jgi:hypothetical protein
MVMRIITVRTPYRYLSVVTVPVTVRTIAYIYTVEEWHWWWQTQDGRERHKKNPLRYHNQLDW